ncbi:MAG: hypothetical protein WCE82_09550 [Halobacteriota archaeon]
MIKITLKMVLMLGIIAVLVVGISGCTNPVQTAQNTVSPSNKAVELANALLTNIKNNPGENSTVVSSNVVENGSDAARMSATIENTTYNSFYPNGTITTYTYNITQFSSTDDAAKFYNEQSVGFTQNDTGVNAPGPTDMVSPYKTVMAHDAAVKHLAVKINSISIFPLSVGASWIVQTDEFVTGGTMTATAK